MDEYRIRLCSVYSEPALEIPAEISLPSGWKLAWHQVETYKALQDPNIDVVFNTAMTGDGKSLAAYLQILQGRDCAIGLYPTNALAEDQEIQVRDYIAEFKPSNKPRVNRLSGCRVGRFMQRMKICEKGVRSLLVLDSQKSYSPIQISSTNLHRGAYPSSLMRLLINSGIGLTKILTSLSSMNFMSSRLPKLQP